MTSMTYSETGLDSIPVGFRFLPTDEELVSYYLKLKMQGDKDYEVRAISEVNICKHEPWDLPGLSVIQSDDQEWFFFCAREINRSRANRATKRGYWKSTGRDRKIKAKGTNTVIGTKKTLVFHEGRVPTGVRTSWVIHEYQPVAFHHHQKAFVLCRLKRKTDVKTNEAPLDDASDFETQVPGHTIPEVDADLASLHQRQRQDYDMASSLQLEEYNQREPPDLDPVLTDDFDYDVMKYLSDDNEQEEDQFVNSLFNQQDEYTLEEVRQSNDSRAPDSPITIYYDGGELSTAYIPRVRSTQSRGLRSPPSIGPFNLQYQQSSRRSEVQRAAPRKVQLQSSSLKVVSLEKAKDASRLSITTNLPQKERSIMESDKEQKIAQGTNADNSPKSKKVRSAGSDWKGSLIFQETSLHGHESSPPSEYFAKCLFGIIFFVFIIWEMLLHGNWY
ncbi:protein ntm1-like 9 [Quercus suber]|uniref:Protein ntm1-like 9 n=1 Tax=Quercus suber TaxID=58331 RepID=A0AAW0M8H1_QUESU